MDPDLPQDSAPQPSPEPRAEDSPERPQLSQERASQAASEKKTDAEKEARRREHFERALKASGKAPKESEDEPEEAEAKDGDEDDEKEDPKDKASRLDKLDKVKSHKHLAKAKESLAGEVKAFEKEQKEYAREREKDQRINQAVTEKYGPIVMGAEQYKAKDYRAAKATVESIFGDKFENISRNLWNATKDGMATADLRHEIESLKAKLADGDKKSTEQKEQETKATAEKQAKADFSKALKAHPLFETGDEELQGRAYQKWKDSWDEDLGEYSLSKKKAADQVYNAELERAQRLTGKRPRSAPATTRETKDPEQRKPAKELGREDKRKYHLERALRQTEASKRARERHA